MFLFVPMALLPFCVQHWKLKRLWFHLLHIVPSGICTHWNDPPVSLLFFQLKKFSSLNLSWSVWCPNPNELFFTFAEVTPVCPCLPLLGSTGLDSGHQMCLTSAEQRERDHLSQPADNDLPNAALTKVCFCKSVFQMISQACSKQWASLLAVSLVPFWRTSRK